MVHITCGCLECIIRAFEAATIFGFLKKTSVMMSFLRNIKTGGNTDNENIEKTVFMMLFIILVFFPKLIRSDFELSRKVMIKA